VEVRKHDVYVIHRLAGDSLQTTNDKLCRLLFFIATLKDAGAGCVTVVAPYMPYARKDRRTKLRDPVTMRYVAQLIEAMGADRVITIDVHNVAAFENAFRRETVHLEARWPMAHAVAKLVNNLPIAVVSPDLGGMKRADRVRVALDEITGRLATPVIMEKHRSDGTVWGTAVAGEAGGTAAVIVDDIIASGTTMLRAIDACRDRGAVKIIALATHGLLSSGPEILLEHPGLDHLLITETVALPTLTANADKLEIIPVQPLFAEAIGFLAGTNPDAVLDAP
jgi:ribose-phosphate pyrophosphokinase